MHTFDPDATEIRPSVQRRHMARLSTTPAPRDQVLPTAVAPQVERQQLVHTTRLELQTYAAQAQLEETVPLRTLTPFVQAVQPPIHPHSPLPQRSFWQRISTGRRRRRVPVLQQVSRVDCGAACLAMILSYYGRPTSVSEVRDRCGTGRDGLSALGLVTAARLYGLRVRAIALHENEFRGLRLPAIVHWQFNHFLIVERWTPTHVHVVDPDLGRRRLAAEEFDQGFTGVVLLLEPGEQFDRHPMAARITIRTYLLRYLRQAPGVFLQIIAATLLLELLGLGIPVLTVVVVDQVIPHQLRTLLLLMAAGILLLVLSRLVLLLLRAVLLIYLQARIGTHVMLKSFEHLLSLPLAFFLRQSSGDLRARLESNALICELLSTQLIATILDGSVVLVYLALLFAQSLVFGALALAIGVLQVVVLLATSGPMRTLASRELAAQGQTEGYETEALVGIATLKAAGAEQQVFEQWSNLFLQQVSGAVRRDALSAITDTLMSTLTGLAPLILLWVGAMQVLNSTMAVGTMLALSALAGAFLAPLSSLVSTGHTLQVVRSHMERVAAVLQAAPEQDGQRHRPPRLTGQITLEGVSFQYDAQAPEVVRNVSVHIQAGHKVAIVGPTGSGKSTLGKLLLGLCVPTTGEIYYDGLPLQSLHYQAVRAQFGVVMQEASLFSGSIRHNICLHTPQMSMERVIRAAQLAELHEEIMQMPMGYETYIAEGGSALSGGQRQRLALARALVHAPAVLLLDEATSALDVVTEQRLEHNLSALGCTQIIIAHRLSTIRHADVILVLEQGRLVESGSHEALLAGKGYYAQLIQSQAASGERCGS
jgi:ATP-binding cassette subfamily B protein